MVPVNDVVALIREETDRTGGGLRRQAAVWRGETTDSLPLLTGGGRIPERDRFPRYDLKEQFEDPEKMAYEHAWAALAVMRSGGDGVPSARVNFGTAFLASVFGLEQQVFPDKMPWLTDHLPKKAVENLTVGDLEPVAEKGLMPAFMRYAAVFRDVFDGTPVRLYLSDTQGPFDLAHLVRGNDLFTDLYDDPAFVHHLMELTTHVYISASRCMKEAIGEPPAGGRHGNAYHMEGCGVRACEDSTTLLSRSAAREFAVPYTGRALAAFGGGWVHFCGRGGHLLDLFLELESVRGINFGNPEYFDPAAVLPKLEEAGTLYLGTFPTRPGESPEAYFARILDPLTRQGSLILSAPAFENAAPEALNEAWRAAQRRRWK